MARVYFATNRNPNRKNNPDDFGVGFSNDDGSANLRFGEAEATTTKVKSVTVYPEQIDEEDEDKSILGSKTLFELLRQRMQERKRDTVLFIHGFNNTFQDALKSAAIIENKYRSEGNKKVNVMAVSWPSDGKATRYRRDRHDAQASGMAVARGLVKAIKFLRDLAQEAMCKQKIHLVAHSMGNYVLRWTMQELREMSGSNLPRLLDQVILAAADEDDDAFEHDWKLARLPDLCKRVSVYSNRGDYILTGSDWTKGNPDRLGSDGPGRPNLLHGKVNSIDCTDVVPLGLSEPHGYYLMTDRVIRDINAALSGKDADVIRKREPTTHSARFRLIK